MKELRTLEERVNWLAEELLFTNERLASLRQRIEAVEQGQRLPADVGVSMAGHEGRLEVASGPPAQEGPEEDSGSSWAHLGQAVLLPRVSAVSFMLVVALILRTMTDNGMIGHLAGSLVGMTYALALIAAGLILYGRKSGLAPVFPTCGAMLLYSIIFETQSHFSTLSGPAGYWLLLAVEIVVVTVGLHCRAKTLLFMAVFASAGVGFAIGLPKPLYVPLGLVVLVNVVAGHEAARQRIAASLPWYSLLFALLFWLLWSYRVNFVLNFEPEKVASLGREWFLPLLGLFWLFYTYASIRQALTREMPPSFFHHLLPSLVAGGGFFAAEAALTPWIGEPRLIGLVAVCLSALYLGLVAWLARRREEGIPGGKEFAAAATILLIQGLAMSAPALLALPIWALAAAVLAVRAHAWRSGGIRVISYCFQLFGLIFALRGHSLSVRETVWPLGLLVAAILAAVNLWLHRWCRRHPPDAYDSAFFTVFDRGDYSAVLLLGLGLFYAFTAASFALAAVLPFGGSAAQSFACSQSLALNLGVVGLLGLGLRRRDREVLAVAGLVIVVAAIKVFLFDLLRARGLPLVSSVFSFGVVAAAGSVTIRKWQQGREPKVEEGWLADEESGRAGCAD